jgi:NADH-quinone oxidoreductase subunit A
MDSFSFNPLFFSGVVLLFALAGIVMLLLPMLIGWLVRPRRPGVEKDAIYECGEPAIGPTRIQFDLRFYVVALLFIVFDVEVAFFFPWAAVFGKANTLSNHYLTSGQREQVSAALLGGTAAPPVDAESARLLMRVAAIDLLVFFGVVLVGFAYLWSRGDLDWVRSVATQRAVDENLAAQPPPDVVPEEEPVLTQ